MWVASLKEFLTLFNVTTTFYLADESLKTQIDNNDNLGTLHLKLKYNYEKQALCVTIIKCCDLPSRDSNNSSDPYVKLQLLPEKQHKVSKANNFKLLFPKNFFQIG